MEERENTSVPYFVHEGILARMERTIKRLWVLCIVLIILFVGTNAGWIYYESLWTEEVITQEIEQDSGENGVNTYNGSIIGGDYYGETEDNDNSTP